MRVANARRARLSAGFESVLATAGLALRLSRMVLVGLLLCSWTGSAGADELSGAYSFDWSSRDGEAYAKALGTRAGQGIASIYEELGHRSAQRIRVVLEDSPSKMRTRALAEQGSAPPDWADGLAYPRAATIYLNSGSPLNETLVTYLHEVSHIALHQAVGGRAMPLWFKEGMAILQSEPFDLERVWLFSQAAAVSGVLPFEDLDRGFPRGGQRVGIAYAQSLHFVGFLRQRLGPDGIESLVAEIRNGAAFRAALEGAAGVELRTLEREWRESLRTQWGWVAVVLGSDSLWGIAAILLVLGYVRQRALRRARLSRLRASDLESETPSIKSSQEFRPPRHN